LMIICSRFYCDFLSLYGPLAIVVVIPVWAGKWSVKLCYLANSSSSFCWIWSSSPFCWIWLIEFF
jgi:hypothetical protein